MSCCGDGSITNDPTLNSLITLTADGELQVNAVLNCPDGIVGPVVPSGNFHVLGTLEVDSTTQLDGNLTIGANKCVVASGTGNITTLGNIDVGSSKCVITASTGNIDTDGDVDVQGDLTIHGSTTFLGEVNIENTNIVSGNLLELNDTTLQTRPTLSITKNGSGSIMQVVDSDSNQKFVIDNDANVLVNTNKFTVDATNGDITVARDAQIGRDVGITRNLGLNGDLSVNTNKFNVVGASGNTSCAGDFAVNTNKFTANATTGDISFTGGITSSGNCTWTLNDNSSSALSIGASGSSDILKIDTTNSAEKIIAGKSLNLKSYTTSQMNALASPTEGDMIFNTDESLVYCYIDGSWTAVGASNPDDPSWSSTTLSYTATSNFVNPATLLSVNSLSPVPSVLYFCCMPSDKSFAIFTTGANPSNAYIFKNVGGTWSHQQTYAMPASTTYFNAVCVGNTVIASAFQTAGFMRIQQLTWDGSSLTAWGSGTDLYNITSSGAQGILSLKYKGNFVFWVNEISGGQFLNARYFNGSSWITLTNSGFSPTQTGNMGWANVEIDTTRNNVIYWSAQNSANSLQVFSFTTSSINTTPVQQFNPSIVNSSDLAESYIVLDETDLTYPYLHLRSRTSTNFGNIYSYEYSGGNWTYRNSYVGSASYLQIGRGTMANMGSYTGVGTGLYVDSSQRMMLSYANSSSDNGYIQLTLSKSVGAISYTFNYGLQNTIGGATFSQNNFNFAIPSDGTIMLSFANLSSTPEYIQIFTRQSGATTNVVYKTIATENVRFQQNFYVDGNLAKIPVVSDSTISTMVSQGTLPEGAIWVSSSSNTYNVFYQNAINRVQLSQVSQAPPVQGYAPNSGNLAINGTIYNCSAITSNIDPLGSCLTKMYGRRDFIRAYLNLSVSGSPTIAIKSCDFLSASNYSLSVSDLGGGSNIIRVSVSPTSNQFSISSITPIAWIQTENNIGIGNANMRQLIAYTYNNASYCEYRPYIFTSPGTASQAGEYIITLAVEFFLLS